MEIKILLCDDHRIFREGLKTLINAQKGMRVIGEAADGMEGVKKVAELRPDIVIMDVSMPGLNGIEATRKIAARGASRVIALSMHSDRRFVSEALKAGASGYLLKDSAFNELSSAIRAVYAGKTCLDPAVAATVVKEYVMSSAAVPAPSSFSMLSPREREVLQMIAEGVSTKQMATRLKLSVKTIETHRKKIMEKLDISTIAGLTKYAVREGLTSP